MKRFLILAVVVAISLTAFAQQKEEDINRVGVFGGYSFLNTPSLGLTQHGFNGSFGVNMNRWMEFGGDFSALKGNTNLGLDKTTLGPTLVPILGSLGIPTAALAGVALPIDATTYTYQVGGQINIRHWVKVTPFIRPVLGVMHETVNVKLTNAALAPIFGAVGLKSSVSDTVPMYGVGGGIDFNASKHFGLRFSVDYAHTKMFDNMLAPQNTVRFSVGPTFKFGSLAPKVK